MKLYRVTYQFDPDDLCLTDIDTESDLIERTCTEDFIDMHDLPNPRTEIEVRLKHNHVHDVIILKIEKVCF